MTDPAALPILRVFAEVLDIPVAHVGGNFFELGGDSLMAVEIGTRVESELGGTFPFDLLFEDGDVHAVAAAVVAATDGDPREQAPPARVGTACVTPVQLPLTFQQERRLAGARQARGQSRDAVAEVILDSFEAVEPVDVDRLRSALAVVWRQQPALRVALDTDLQQIADCSQPCPDRVRSRVSRCDDQTPWALEDGELWRLEICPADDTELRTHVHLAISHLIADAASLDVFWSSLWQAYDDQPGDEDGCACRTGYVTYVREQGAGQGWNASELEQRRALLDRRNSPYGYVDLPVTLPMSEIGSRAVTSRRLVGPEVSAEIIALASRQGTTAFVVMLQVAMEAIADATGSTTPMVYSYVDTRRTAEARAAMGWMSSTVLFVDTLADTREDAMAVARRVAGDALVHGARGTQDLHLLVAPTKRPLSMPSLAISMHSLSYADWAHHHLAVRRMRAEAEDQGLPRGRIELELGPDGVRCSYEAERYAPEIIDAFVDRIATGLTTLVETSDRSERGHASRSPERR